MFRTAREFYGRAYALASNEVEEKQIMPYLMASIRQQANRNPIPQIQDENGNPMPLREETEEIKRQKEAIEKAITMHIRNLTEEEPIEGISSLKEMDFRFRQEMTYAGWTLTEKEGKVVIYTYLPTLHKPTEVA